MKVYKGTDKDIKCRGYQFTPGVEAVEDEAKLCSKGFHACEAPLDVLGYYPPGLGSRYFEAELEAVSPERKNDDTKVCGKRITLSSCPDDGVRAGGIHRGTRREVPAVL